MDARLASTVAVYYGFFCVYWIDRSMDSTHTVSTFDFVIALTPFERKLLQGIQTEYAHLLNQVSLAHLRSTLEDYRKEDEGDDSDSGQERLRIDLVNEQSSDGSECEQSSSSPQSSMNVSNDVSDSSAEMAGNERSGVHGVLRDVLFRRWRWASS